MSVSNLVPELIDVAINDRAGFRWKDYVSLTFDAVFQWRIGFRPVDEVSMFSFEIDISEVEGTDGTHPRASKPTQFEDDVMALPPVVWIASEMSYEFDRGRRVQSNVAGFLTLA